MKILFLTEGKNVPASRFRVYQYLYYLKEEGIKYKICACWLEKYYLPQCHKKEFIGKIIVYFYFGVKFINRLCCILISPFYDIVFLQRDLLPWRVPFLEKLLRKIAKNIIFDFDDAIYIYSPQKIPKIIKLSDVVIVGNEYLKNYVQKYNSSVEIIPTCVDTQKYHPAIKDKQSKVVIGWIGTSSGLENLKIVSEVIKILNQRYNIAFKIISDYLQDLSFLKDLKIVYHRWSRQTELKDLQSFDVGIMPLEGNEFNKGKCGFKALLCMSCGIPVVVSPVGVNKEIIQDGINGFLADTEEEWIQKLSLLIEDGELRRRMGNAARKTVEEYYSIRTNAMKFLTILEKVYTQKG